MAHTPNPNQWQDNPYDGRRRSEVVGLPGGSWADLKTIAQYQKWLILCILFYFVSVGLQFLFPPDIRRVYGVFVLFVVIIGAVMGFLISVKVYSVTMGILYGFLMLIPCFGLIFLLIVNSRANRLLQDNGIRVGFLGADMSAF
jgi:hypothetical protein